MTYDLFSQTPLGRALIVPEHLNDPEKINEFEKE